MSPLRRMKFGTMRSLYWFPIAAVAHEYFYKVKIINGRSMQPTLNPDWSPTRDVGLFNVFAVQVKRNFARGDVVAFASPVNPKRMLVKRILAIEGDVVKTLPPQSDPTLRVPKGHVWVEGDDTFRTDDSNRFGPVPVALIESKLEFIIWPLNRWGTFRSKPSALDLDGLDEQSRKRRLEAIERDRWRESRVNRSMDDANTEDIRH